MASLLKIVDRERPDESVSWSYWRQLDKHRLEYAQILARLRADRLWQQLEPTEQTNFLANLFSPFDVEPGLYDALLQAAAHD